MAYTSLSDALAKLEVSESELKKLVKERGMQVFMMGGEDGSKKTICFSNEDVDELAKELKDEDSFALPVQDHLGESGDSVEASKSLDLDVDEGPGGTIILDSDEEDLTLDLSDDAKAAAEEEPSIDVESDEEELTLADDDEELELSDDDDELSLADDDDELSLADEDEEELSLEDDGEDELSISDDDDDELELSDDDELELSDDDDEELELSDDEDEAPAAAEEDSAEDSDLDLDDGDLDLGMDDEDDLGLDFDDEDSDDKDLSDVELDDEGGASETLSFDNGDETLSISGEDGDETLDFDDDDGDDIDLPDDSFSMDGDDDDIDIDDDEEESEFLDVSEDDEDTAYRQPSTKIVDEDGLFFIWPLLVIFCFGVVVFAGVISVGLVQDIQLDQGIAFGKGFFSDLSSYVKQNVKIPK